MTHVARGSEDYDNATLCKSRGVLDLIGSREVRGFLNGQSSRSGLWFRPLRREPLFC